MKNVIASILFFTPLAVPEFVEANDLLSPHQRATLDSKSPPPEDTQPVLLKQCADIIVKDNRP